MNPRHRLILTTVFCGSIAIGAVAWSQRHLARCRVLARQTANDLALCQRLANQIEPLRLAPARARTHEVDQPELARQIEQAAVTAGIDPKQIDRITPEPPRHLAGGSYRQVVVRLTLRNVTLLQTTTLMHALATDTPALSTSALRLTTPHETSTHAGWHAELPLAYLVYAPLAPASPGKQTPSVPSSSPSGS